MDRGQERDGLVRIDTGKLERLMLRKRLTKSQLAEKAEVARNTLLRALRGQGIFASSAMRLARAVGINVDELVVADGREQAIEAAAETGEWAIDDYLGPWVTASNDLQFRVCRMRHRFIAGRLGRGKCYDLLNPSTRNRERLQECLVRHPTVSERIGPHPHVVENLSAAPGTGDDTWWVVDRWVEGLTLEQHLCGNPLEHDKLPGLMLGIAKGLEALHAANVVFRELAPSRVILLRENGRPILADFELAKLLDGAPTVSADWPDDPYRAPEIESGSASGASDLYSWARILVEAATGTLPPKGLENDLLDGAALPVPVRKAALDCLAPGPSDRPKSVQQLVRRIRWWTANK